MSQNFRDVIKELNLTEYNIESIEIDLDKVVSINSRWIPTIAYSKNGKPYAYLRSSEESSSLKEEVISKITSSGVSFPFLKAIKACKIDIYIALPKDKVILKDGKSLRKIDLSNMWPVIENGVAEALGVDDSLSVELNLHKTVSKDSKYYLRLEVITYGE